eukprot:6454744-Amphidinium_carterae.3
MNRCGNIRPKGRGQGNLWHPQNCRAHALYTMARLRPPGCGTASHPGAQGFQPAYLSLAAGLRFIRLLGKAAILSCTCQQQHEAQPCRLLRHHGWVYSTTVDVSTESLQKRTHDESSPKGHSQHVRLM